MSLELEMMNEENGRLRRFNATLQAQLKKQDAELDMLKKRVSLIVSEKHVQNSQEIVQDSAEIRRIFEEDEK